MKAQKILVTGGAGYIGSHTVVALAEAGYQPIVVDNYVNSSPSVLKNIARIIGAEVSAYETDCNDRTALGAVFAKEAPLEGVIHFAAYKAVGESVQKPLAYYHNNLHSLLTLLDVMLEYQTTNLVFSSSCTVYGQPAELPVTEQSPVLPAESPYGNTKQIGEEMLRDAVASEQPLRAVALRYFNPIGAHPSGLIGELPLGVPNNLAPFITQTAAGVRKQLSVFGDDYPTPDGTCIRDYIHVMDLANAHVRAFEYLAQQTEGGYYDTFNIGTGRGQSVLEVIKSFERVSKERLNYRMAPRRPGDVTQVWGDVSKAEKTLGWRAEKTIDDAMRDAWRWEQRIRQQPTAE